MKKRVFISSPSNRWLDPRRKGLKSAILERLIDKGLEPQEFWESGTSENLAWSFDNVDSVMKKCIGAVILGFPRWIVTDQAVERRMVGEYNHYEGAVALSHGLPVLLMAEEGVDNRGIVWTGGGRTITFIPQDADASWIQEDDFSKRFDAWLRDIEARHDVFLGYCSQSSGTAAQVQLYLERHGASVLNWAMDFRAGGSILSEIESASNSCSCGIFLFTEDDPLKGSDGVAAPRDNVVFEAGYFMSAKGPERCLIIRQGAAKMPADVGGAIYLHLDKKGDVASIEGKLASFLEKNL